METLLLSSGGNGIPWSSAAMAADDGDDKGEMVETRSMDQIFHDGGYESKYLQNLTSTVKSLVWSKADFTFTWAESVRHILEDLSSSQSGSTDTECRAPASEHASVSEKDKAELRLAIEILEGELAASQKSFRELDAERRNTLSRLLELKGSIRVFCRMRPFLSHEKQKEFGPEMNPDSDTVSVNDGGKSRVYKLDCVFLPTYSQDEVFAEVEPVVKSALDGHNVCIFAYGQTGTGKTFTMKGTPDCPGLIPRTIQELFHHASLDQGEDYIFKFSMIEIYMKELRDLLGTRTTKSVDHLPKCLNVRMAKGSVEIENLKEIRVKNVDQAMKLYMIGSKRRSTSETNSNKSSSRSHCLIRISISCPSEISKGRNTSKLWMVDLGGSERLVKTKATGQTLEEGKAINTSLLALGSVIRALHEKLPHVPFRNDHLTNILRDSLGSESRALMLVHISPRVDDIGETMCSLNFAAQVKGVELDRDLLPELKVQRQAEMAALMKHLRILEDYCLSARRTILTGEFLIRQKKTQLANIDPSSAYPESVISQDDQTLDTLSINSGNVAERSVWLPRYMSSTVTSRIRNDFGEHLYSFQQNRTMQRRKKDNIKLFESASTIPVDRKTDRSDCETESIASSNTSLGRSRPPIPRRRPDRFYSEKSNPNSNKEICKIQNRHTSARLIKNGEVGLDPVASSPKAFLKFESQRPPCCPLPKHTSPIMKNVCGNKSKEQRSDLLPGCIIPNKTGQVDRHDPQGSSWDAYSARMDHAAVPIDESEPKTPERIDMINQAQEHENVVKEHHLEVAQMVTAKAGGTPILDAITPNCQGFLPSNSEIGDAQYMSSKGSRLISRTAMPSCKRVLAFQEPDTEIMGASEEIHGDGRNSSSQVMENEMIPVNPMKELSSPCYNGQPQEPRTGIHSDDKMYSYLHQTVKKGFSDEPTSHQFDHPRDGDQEISEDHTSHEVDQLRNGDQWISEEPTSHEVDQLRNGDQWISEEPTSYQLNHSKNGGQVTSEVPIIHPLAQPRNGDKDMQGDDLGINHIQELVLVSSNEQIHEHIAKIELNKVSPEEALVQSNQKQLMVEPSKGHCSPVRTILQLFWEKIMFMDLGFEDRFYSALLR